MGRRSRGSQDKHDARVRQEARKLERDGWVVQADLHGYTKPSPIGKDGFVPDIFATKAGHNRIVEVETPESVATDAAQRAAFERSAAHRTHTKFETIVTEE